MDSSVSRTWPVICHSPTLQRQLFQNEFQSNTALKRRKCIPTFPFMKIFLAFKVSDGKCKALDTPAHETRRFLCQQLVSIEENFRVCSV